MITVCVLVVPASPVQAQTSTYFPLALGKQWVLHSRAWNIDLSFQVTAVEDGAFRVKINNPWMPWEVLLFPVKEKVYLQSLRMGPQTVWTGGYALYHDLSAPAGSNVAVSLGNLRVVSRTRSVTTDTRTYSNCVKVELAGSTGFTQAWTFAAGVGLVEFEFGGTTFVLKEAASTLSVGAALNAPTSPAPVPKGDRILAVNVNTSAANHYVSAFSRGAAVGMETTSLHFDWNVLEPSPQFYQKAHLEIANLFYPAQAVGVILTLAPIHNVANNLPSDLKGLPLDHPVVIARFKQLLDVVLASTTNLDLKTIVIGSEIDGFMRADSARWSQFSTFFAEAAAHIRAAKPGARVATEFTLNGFLGEAQPHLKTINQYSDVVGVSYYPLDLEGLVLDPTVVSRHFKAISDAFPQKSIHFTQFGFPTSSVLRSSESLQSEFIRETFKAWDAHGSRVKLLNFTFLHDLDRNVVSGVCGYFEVASTSCKELLATLGLRTFDGTDKQAIDVLDSESLMRGW